MHWRKAAFAVSVACVVATLPANAGEARTWYAGVDLSASDTDFSGMINAVSCGGPPCPVPGEDFSRSSLSTGYGVSATLGKKLGMFRLEAELGYSNADATQYAQLSQMTAMLNGLFDLSVSDSITFSLGGGVGIDFVSWDHGNSEIDDSSLAYQGIVGIGFALTDTIDLTLDYRYKSVADVAFEVMTQYTPTTIVYVDIDEVDTQSLSVGIRFAL